MSLSQAITDTTAPSSSSSSVPSYSYGTSKIVRTAVAAGVIILAITALMLFFKISTWLRYRQRLRREDALTNTIQSEQRATAYEIAAWSDQPGQAPVWGEGRKAKKSRKEMRSEVRAMKRGGANAYAVIEWEGVPS